MEVWKGLKMENDLPAQARGRYIRKSGSQLQLLQPPLLPIVVSLGLILKQ